jgi:hypothetical protein
MGESRQLLAARDQLARAEAAFRGPEGVYHLEEGLALLDDLIATASEADRVIARNIASTYAIRICGTVRKLVQADRALPEPELEHLFRLLLAFDQCDLELPEHASATKIDLVRLLIERYHEGHSPEEKKEALDRLESMRRSSK